MSRKYPIPHQPHKVPSLTDQYIALWRLDEAAAGTNMSDAGIRARTLTVAGSPPVSGPLYFRQGSVGSRQFDGSSQWGVRTHDANDELLFQDEWTIEAWIKPTATNGRRTIFSFSEYQAGPTLTANEQCWIGIVAGYLSARWEYGSGTNVDTTSSLPSVVNIAQFTNNYVYHVAARKSRSISRPGKYKCDLFVNGQLASYDTDNLENSTGGSISRMTIGACFRDGSSTTNPGSEFAGFIDDVLITRVAKPDYAIREDYMRGARHFVFQHATNDVLVDAGDPTSTESKPAVNVITRVRVETFFDAFGTSYYTDFSNQQMENAPYESSEFDSISVNKAAMLKGVRFSDDVDDQGATATVTLAQRFHMNNISPFMYSPTNQLNPFNLNSVPALRAGRKIIVEVAPVPANCDNTVRTRDYESTLFPFEPVKTWMVVFEGFISSASVANDEVVIQCVDKMSPLQDQWIEPDIDGKERTYGAVSAIDVQSQLQAIIDDNDPAAFELFDPTGGSVALKTDGSNKINVTFMSGGGTSMSDGRLHPLIAGDRFSIEGSTNYNGTWTVESASDQVVVTVQTPGPFADENAGTVRCSKGYRELSAKTPQIDVHDDPLWDVFEWLASTGKCVSQELEDVMSQLGWKVGYRWDDNLGFFRLRLYNPADLTGTAYIAPQDILSVDRQSIKKDDVRNVVVVEYSGTTTDSVGSYIREFEFAIDRTSIETYGRKYCRVSLPSTGLINSSSEAQELASRILEDLKEPVAELEITIPLRLDIETGDQITIGEEVSVSNFNAQPVYFSKGADMVFGCLRVEHEISEKTRRTKLKLRSAAPASRVRKHFDVIHASGSVAGLGIRPPRQPAAPTVTTTKLAAGTNLYGLRVQWAHPINNLNNAFDEMEVHAVTPQDLAFTPSSATLRTVVRGTESMFFGLAASTGYTVKIVARDRMRNQSPASTGVNVTTVA